MDLEKLAKLKSMGWSTEDLVIHFGRKSETIKWWFGVFRREKAKRRSVLKILGDKNNEDQFLAFVLSVAIYVGLFSPPKRTKSSFLVRGSGVRRRSGGFVNIVNATRNPITRIPTIDGVLYVDSSAVLDTSYVQTGLMH